MHTALPVSVEGYTRNSASSRRMSGQESGPGKGRGRSAKNLSENSGREAGLAWKEGFRGWLTGGYVRRAVPRYEFGNLHGSVKASHVLLGDISIARGRPSPCHLRP